MKKNYTRQILSLVLLLLSNVVGFAQVTTTFSYTGGVQTYTVPAGVTFLDVEVKGAEGGSGLGTGAGAGGQGGRVKGRLIVTPGTILYIFVGSAGTPFSAGFNGGGTQSSTGGGGGGGASDIRIGGTVNSNRVVVAAGGGGGGAGGSVPGFAGGAGGDLTGQDGLPATSLGGKGGMQAVGGPGGGTGFCGGTGTAGGIGIFGQGANATGNGGAGGGGFYGGGSGGNNSGGTCSNGAGGGGGGSSMVSASAVSSDTIWIGGNSGNGSVKIKTPQVPTVTTVNATQQSPNWFLEGLVLPNGATTNAFFEISNSPGLSSGVITVAATQNPIADTASAPKPVSAQVGGLLTNTTYYYRVKAVNSVGTTNGAILSFITPNTKPVAISGKAQNISMCQNTKDYQLTSVLHVSDTDPAQSITWSVAQMPVKNGTLSGFSSSNTAVAGSSNITPGNAISYTPVTGFNGTDTFRIQISDGKVSDTIVFTAFITPLPAPIISRNGFDLNTGIFALYQWKRNNIDLVGATGQTYTMQEGGEYTVTVTDGNGCINTSNIYKYPTVSVDEVDAGTFNIYPNPVTTVLHVEAPEGSSLSIASMDGKIAISQPVGKVDVSTLVPAVYVLRIYDRTGVILKTTKLVKVQ